MKTLFDDSSFNEILDRINMLTPTTRAEWGKMNVAQMIAHCKEAFKVPLSDKRTPRIFMGLIFGWMMKSKLYNDSPYGKNLPTAPNFIIQGERNFEVEKRELMELVSKFFLAGPDGMNKYPHPFFGKITPEQWGKSMYKHIDHHLRQFGA